MGLCLGTSAYIGLAYVLLERPTGIHGTSNEGHVLPSAFIHEIDISVEHPHCCGVVQSLVLSIDTVLLTMTMTIVTGRALSIIIGLIWLGSNFTLGTIMYG